MNPTLTDRFSYYLAAAATLLATLFCVWQTGDVGQSFFVGLITGALVFVSYTLVRWLVLAIKG